MQMECLNKLGLPTMQFLLFEWYMMHEILTDVVIMICGLINLVFGLSGPLSLNWDSEACL